MILILVDNYARQAKGKLIDREKLLIWKTKLFDKLECGWKSYWITFLMEARGDPVLRLLTSIIVLAFISSGLRRIVWPVPPPYRIIRMSCVSQKMVIIMKKLLFEQQEHMPNI